MPRPAINPPGARYVIPVHTLVRLARYLDFSGQSRSYRTQKRLELNEVFSFHGPGILVFRVEDWLLTIPAERIIRRDHPVIDAILFNIECRPPSSQQLLAWLDGRGCSEYARPKRWRDTMLDVRAGQEILWRSDRGEQEVIVSEVRLYRTNRPSENGRIVESGRWWLEQTPINCHR